MNRKIKIVTIDGDGCLFAYTNVGSDFHSSWDALGFAYGLKKVWDERARKYYPLKTYDGHWAREDAADLTGRVVSDSESVLYPVPYSPGVREFLTAARGKLLCGLLSGCLDIAGKKAEQELGLDFCYCNTLHRDNGVFTGTVDYLVPTWQKHFHIPALCDRFNVAPEEICHVGDNENDISCFERVGLPVAFRPKKENVGKVARHVIHDFRELSAILGVGI